MGPKKFGDIKILGTRKFWVWVKKSFGKKRLRVNNFLGNQKFGYPKKLGPKKFGYIEIWGTKCFLVQTKFWVQKMLVPKIISVLNKILDKRKFGSEKLLVHKKVGKNIFGFNKVLGPKILGPKKIFGAKKVWVQNNLMCKKFLCQK